MTKKTPLYQAHLAAGAKLINFHGWDMPLHYGSQINEHQAVRNHAGFFDVSHMTIVDLLGAGSRQFLRQLLTNDVDKLKHPGQALYTCMCNEQGGIIDDLIVYQRNTDSYRLILNAATRDRDIAWIREKIEGFATGLQEQQDLAMLAVQGPEAIPKTLSILETPAADAVSTLQRFECVDVNDWFFARTGYTGEHGLEIVLPQDELLPLWDKLLELGIKPCGLASRDTLRLEAGMMLCGQDMDETTTPLESGLAWTIAWEPQDRNFIGMGALLSQKEQGPKRKLIGLALEGKAIMRTGHRVITPNFPDGSITSGIYSPSLKKSIALARIPNQTTEEISVEIRDQEYPVTVTRLPFLNPTK